MRAGLVIRRTMSAANRSTLLAVLLAAVASTVLSRPDAAAQPRPNVIVVMADDLGYGDLGAYGSPDARTPHLDALAARGLRFTDHYAGGPVCTPSRYALLTGLHAFRAGDPLMLRPLAWDNTRSGIGRGAVTMAEALEDAGYVTALIGKWHLGHGRALTGSSGNTEFHPTRHGFDSFFGLLSGAIDYNTHWNRSLYLDWWDGQQRRPEDNDLYATHVLGDRAVDYIDAHAGAGTTAPPFFLYLPVTTPHVGATLGQDQLAPLQLPIGEEREYLSRFDDLYPDDRTPRKRFLAMVAVLDDEVGRIVDALERNGLMENTLLWVTSDNGAVERVGSNGPLRGGKFTPYEGGVRVPSFVVWEGQIAPGTSAQVAGNIDALPTLLALAGETPPDPVDGLDLSEHLLGAPPSERGIAVPSTAYGDVYRLGRWKYVRRYRSNGTPYPAELYDLQADLGERTNVAGAHPDVVALLASLMPYGTQPRVHAPGRPRSEVALPSASATSPASLRVLPNPSAGEGAAELTLTAGGAVRVELLDGLGRRLAVLHDGALDEGVHRMPLPAGRPAVVVVRAVGPFGVLTARALSVRGAP
jgi:arylsulfatase A-like enzyme